MHPQISFHTTVLIPGPPSSPTSVDSGSFSLWPLRSVSAVSCWGLRSSSHFYSAPLVTEALLFPLVRSIPHCSCSFLTFSCWRRLRWWAGELESKEERKEFILWYFGNWNPGRSLRTWLEAKMLVSPVTEWSEAGLFLSQHCDPCLVGSCQHQWCAVGSEVPLIHLLPAALWEERDNRRISSTARNLSEIEQSTVEHNTYHITRLCAWELLPWHLEVTIPRVAVLLNCPPSHSSRLVALKLLIWSLTTISFIPAAELWEKKKKSSISLKTDAASVLSRSIKYVKYGLCIMLILVKF